MKQITYTEEQVQQMRALLNAITVTGVQNARQIAIIAQVLDTGTTTEEGED